MQLLSNPTNGLYIVAAIFVFLLYLQANTQAYWDEVEEEKFYCEQVGKGIWPDYLKLEQQGECDKWRKKSA